jgi:hypothetical protein
MWRVKDESVSMERLDGETILINFDTGQYFSFQGPSADILWLIQQGVDRSHWAASIKDAFPALVIDDSFDQGIDSFLEGLGEVGIVRDGSGEGTLADTGGPAIALPDDYVRAAWTAPTVHANDDLVDLLVIDPIHDTSEDGWPETRPS